MSLTNPDAAAETRAQLLKQTQPAAQAEPELLDTKARLEAARAEATREIQVLGEPVEFRSPGAGAIRDAMQLRQRAMDGDGDAELELFDHLLETLAEHSCDPALDADFWGGFAAGTLQQVFEDLVSGGMTDEMQEKIDQFR